MDTVLAIRELTLPADSCILDAFLAGPLGFVFERHWVKTGGQSDDF